MRRILAVLAVVVVLTGSGGAGGEPGSAVDRARLAAGHVLHGTDAEFAGSRADLKGWSAKDLLAVIDAARAQRFGAGHDLDVLMPSSEPLQTDEGAPAHAEGVALVAALEAPKFLRFRLRAWPLRLEERYAARWLGAYAPPPSGSVREVPATYAQVLLRAAGQGSFVRAEPWAPLVLADGQSGLWGTGGAFRYVQDYDVEMGMGGAYAGGPIIGSLREGLRLGVLARRTAPGVTLEVDAQWSEALRPIQTFETEVATVTGSPRVTIQLPELRIMSLREVVQLPRDGWVLAATGRPFPEGDGPGTERRLVLLQVEVLAR